MKYYLMSDLELLRCAVGEKHASALYQGVLAPIFNEAPDGNTRAHAILAAVHELLKRALAEELRRECVFKEPGAVRNYLRAFFAGKEHEVFIGLFLDSQHRLIAAEVLARGTIDGAAVYPREVVKRALKLNAAAVIFAHNHPSGIAEPSAADRALTDRLKHALGTVDIRTLDHFVVGGTTTVSFAERGLL